jgi:hypothetical protein
VVQVLVDASTRKSLRLYVAFEALVTKGTQRSKIFS